MKKKLLALTCLALASTMMLGSCFGGGGTDSSADNNNSTTSTTDSTGDSTTSTSKKTIKAPRTDIAGFDADYLPASSTPRQQGTIDVSLVFEDTLKGWEALAAEYERLHDGEVVVQLDKTYSDASNYQTALNDEIKGETQWDIVQGNLFMGNGLQSNCINMASAVNAENHYAGMDGEDVRYWIDVLTEDAYLTDKSGASTNTFIMNSEGLQTAWFVNTVALEAAKGQGYNGGDTPATWDELMDLCRCMELAGYNNPLGIALDDDSIGASQFTWLLRVYGDYYYRNEYQNIMMSDDYVYDKASKNPERITGYSVSGNKFYYSIFKNTDKTYYVGPESAKYQEFLGQFEKMKPYLRESAADSQQSGLSVLRTKFATQSEGKDSPQLFLDYVGAGLRFQDNENANFQVEFFDYPKMVSEGNFIPEGTILRDVGGNGGYLSILKHDEAQNKLNLDFIKFVVSPYGQSIYYEALSKEGSYPMGMTTVVNDYVAIPDEWVTFFKAEQIEFNGLVDANPYVSYLLRGFSDEPATTAALLKGWKHYLTGTNYTKMNFVVDWVNAMETDWLTYCTKYGKNPEMRDNRTGTDTL